MTKVPEEVILLHGLGETPLYMLALQLGLTAAGYNVHNVGYPSTRYACAELTDRFVAPLLTKHADAPRLHLVGHSMGCVLIRAALAQQIPANLGRVVLIAPGNRGSEMLEIQRRLPLMQALLGPALQEGGTGDECYAYRLPEPVEYEVSIVSGTVTYDPLSLWMPWPHDGRISLERTQLKGATDTLAFPAPHDGLQAHPWIVWQTACFLHNGRFARL